MGLGSLLTFVGRREYLWTWTTRRGVWAIVGAHVHGLVVIEFGVAVGHGDVFLGDVFLGDAFLGDDFVRRKKSRDALRPTCRRTGDSNVGRERRWRKRGERL